MFTKKLLFDLRSQNTLNVAPDTQSVQIFLLLSLNSAHSGGGKGCFDASVLKD
jgi:hypothetical protein